MDTMLSHKANGAANRDKEYHLLRNIVEVLSLVDTFVKRNLSWAVYSCQEGNLGTSVDNIPNIHSIRVLIVIT